MNAFDLLLSVEREKAEAIREQNEILKENTEKEIRARDRVNISREEYEQMKKQIELLTAENTGFRRLFDKTKLPIDKPIIQDTVKMSKYYNQMSYRTQYVIQFEVDEI